MNIIFPIAGKGSRFKEKSYLSEKAFINFRGYPILYWILNNLSLGKKDKVYFVYNTERYQKDLFDNLMKKHFNKVEYDTFPILKETNGAAETVYNFINASQALKEKEPFLLLDCDNFYTENILKKIRNCKKSCIFYTEVEKHNNEFSFILLNKLNNVVNIKEKIGISNNVCTGAYYFDSVKTFKNGYNSIDKSIDKEIYISSVYEELLKKSIHVATRKVDIKNYHCLGTPGQMIVKSYDKQFVDSEKKVFCFDLDGTLVNFPDKIGDYSTCKPIVKNIDFLKLLKEQGHKIVIQTARKMKTANNNIAIATSLAKDEVENTLKKYDVPYDELFYGKPYADFYIDDLAINAYSDLEKETGFYFEKIIGRTENKIEFIDNFCIKNTSNQGEVFYYKNMPNEIKHMFPTVYKINKNNLYFEKINGATFSFLYNNDLLKLSTFVQLLEMIDELHKTKNKQNINCNAKEIYSEKLKDRVKINYKFLKNENVFDKKYNNLIKTLEAYEESIKSYCIIHGDPVFTNVFLCDNNNIKLIDPRGKIGNINTLYGDCFYDYAKIYQSIIGYDMIVYNKKLHLSTEKIKILNYFESYFKEKYNKENFDILKNITKCLLLSLIPLHNKEAHKKQFIELYKQL